MKAKFLAPCIVAASCTLVLTACQKREETPASSAPSATNSTASKGEEKAPVRASRIPTADFLNAALEGDSKIVRSALRAGTETDVVDEGGRSALMMAAFNGHTELVHLLAKKGAKIERRDATGRSALMYASTGPNANTVALLLKLGADINAHDIAEKWTALMFAAAEGHLDVVKLLLEHGADKSLVDTDGDSAEAFAAQRGHTAVIDLLKADK